MHTLHTYTHTHTHTHSIDPAVCHKTVSIQNTSQMQHTNFYSVQYYKRSIKQYQNHLYTKNISTESKYLGIFLRLL